LQGNGAKERPAAKNREKKYRLHHALLTRKISNRIWPVVHRFTIRRSQLVVMQTRYYKLNVAYKCKHDFLPLMALIRIVEYEAVEDDLYEL
jgi:hypothetical protein